MFLKLVSCFPKLFAGIKSLSSFHIFFDFWCKHLFSIALLWCCGMSHNEKYQMNRWMDKHSFNCSAKTSKELFSRSLVYHSLQPHGLHHARPPCPSPTPGAYSNLCPLSQWCHPTISSCCPLLLPPSVFPRIRVFSKKSVLHIRWQSIGVSASASVLLMNIQDWFPLGWTGWISLKSKELSRVFSKVLSILYSPTLTFIHDYWKNHSFD